MNDAYFRAVYFSQFVTMTDMITKPGKYLTRCGETVTITKVSDRHDFGCHGTYDNCGTFERWHKSGVRSAYPEWQSDNDIVGMPLQNAQ